MKKDIILAGVGGQGILTIATIIGTAAVEADMNLKQAEVHGMSQRGGDVQSHLRISDEPIFSDLVPRGKCDVILSVEPMEALRYLPYLAEDGILIANTKPFINIPNYPQQPELDKMLNDVPNHIKIDADAIAKELGSTRAMNMVMLGAAINHLGLSLDKFEQAVKTVFGRKGDAIVEMNIKALRAGKANAEKNAK
ncbi:MAG: indolepyruvate oxidoreductase subunit beta [Candidatus Cloacimonadales bacterium]